MPQAADISAGFDAVPLPRLGQAGRWRTEAMRAYGRPTLLWFTKGQGRITVSGVTRGYGAHNAVFLPAGTMHGFDMLGQVYGTQFFFAPEVADALPDQALHLRVRDARRQTELASLLDQVVQEIKREDASRGQALRLLTGLLGVWLSRQHDLHEPDVTEKNAANRIVAAYTALVERDFRSPKSVAEYAAELGITPTHLSRACNQAGGRSASAFLADRTQFEAKRLLTETNLPVKEIARRLGFTSAAYFTRAFVKFTGQAPTRFRRANSRPIAPL